MDYIERIDKDLVEDSIKEVAGLTQAVEALREEVRELREIVLNTHKTSKNLERIVDAEELPLDWNYPTITKEIAAAVISSNGLKTASEKLGMPVKELDTILKESGIPHLYGDKWRNSIKAAVAGKEPVDTLQYPEKWLDEDWQRRLLGYLKNNGFKATVERLNSNQTTVGRFLQTHCGWSSK